MDEIRQKNGNKGSAPIPKSDTDSRLLPNKEGGYEANDTPMVTTESVGGLIVVSDVVIGIVEHHQLDTLLDAVQNDFEVDAERVMADSADTTGENWTIAEAKNVELNGSLFRHGLPELFGGLILIPVVAHAHRPRRFTLQFHLEGDEIHQVLERDESLQFALVDDHQA